MRERLLRATVDTLFELGYSRTTTVEIARRAGVSRGAQLHHFPTKQSLVVEAIAYLTQKRHEAFRADISAISPSESRTDAAIEIAWRGYTSPLFFAWLEVRIASRTDEVLRKELERAAPQHLSAFEEDLTSVLPTVPFGGEEARPLVTAFVLAVFNGSGLLQLSDSDGTRSKAAIETLKLLAKSFGR